MNIGKGVLGAVTGFITGGPAGAAAGGIGGLMSPKGTSATGTSNTVNTSQGYVNPTVPDWLDTYLRSQVTSSQALGQTPYNPYGGARVSPLTPDELQSYGIVRDLQGQAQLGLNNATGITQEVANRGLNGATQGQIDQYWLFRWFQKRSCSRSTVRQLLKANG